jgi:hypothetical protein
MCQFRFICVSFDQNALARYSNRMPLREAEPMLEKMIRTFWIVFICCAAAHAQEGERGVQPRGMLSRARSTNPTIASQEWKSNRLIAAALSHPVLVAPSAPVQARDGGNSALIGVLRKQSAAVRALIAVQPAGASQGGTMLNGGTRQPPKSQLLAAAGSTPLIGAGKTMSGSIGSGASATPSNAQSSPTRHQAPSSPPQKIGAQAPLQTQVCMAGIASVDGQKSGILFSPVPGTEGMFVIQGCGFGTTPGEVFLTGPQYAPMLASATRGLLGSATVPDRVSFQIATNGWSDRQIVVQIDPNASGFYDAKNVTVVVKTAGGQQYQSGGFNFSAAREAQVLASLLEPQGCTPQSSGPACVPIGVKLAAVTPVPALLTQTWSPLRSVCLIQEKPSPLRAKPVGPRFLRLPILRSLSSAARISINFISSPDSSSTRTPECSCAMPARTAPIVSRSTACIQRTGTGL